MTLFLNRLNRSPSHESSHVRVCSHDQETIENISPKLKIWLEEKNVIIWNWNLEKEKLHYFLLVGSTSLLPFGLQDFSFIFG